MCYHKSRGLDLEQALDEIYEKYGFYHEELLALNFEGKEGGEKIARIMEYFRSNREKPIFTEKPTSVDDILTLKRTDFSSNNSSNLDLPQSNVLGFSFESGNKLWLRPSGTEPKIKFYIMIKETEGGLEDKKAKAYKKASALGSFIENLVKDL